MNKVILICCCLLVALQAKANVVQAQKQLSPQLDLESKAEELRIQDSIKNFQDSLQFLWVKKADPRRQNQFLDSLKAVYTVNDGDLFAWRSQFKGKTGVFQSGILKPIRELWILFTIAILILLFSILKMNYSAPLNAMMHALYSDTAFAQINKEENVFNKWPFLALYILFGFIIGMFIFLGAKSYFPAYRLPNWSFYLGLSCLVLIFFTMKILIAKLLGFIFDNERLARKYNAILYISYFSVSMFLLPIVLTFALIPQKSIDLLSIFISLCLLILYISQFYRFSYSTLKGHKFSKFYLILYFCTLEIGPLLILIKLIGL